MNLIMDECFRDRITLLDDLFSDEDLLSVENTVYTDLSFLRCVNVDHGKRDIKSSGGITDLKLTSGVFKVSIKLPIEFLYILRSSKRNARSWC
ncbi:hypothetical protein HanRHA438_Chr04g0174771 [Helianthus annuus]|nr:hypothetical protein HanRHA438_Chr04g0174771 [Helianthus annuus]